MAKKRKSKPKKKSSPKLSPTRFQKQDDKGLFSFDATRKYVFKWGLITGAIGGFFMVGQQDTYIWPIVGVMSVVFISNYHINKASLRIPRWHATFWAFLGVAFCALLIFFFCYYCFFMNSVFDDYLLKWRRKFRRK